jgi:hypothetical protein
MIEFMPKIEKKDEFVKVLRNEVLPLLKKQPGFREILPLFPESTTDRVITVSLWTDKKMAERYEFDVYPKVEGILRPYLSSPVTFKHYNLETSLCTHFVEALTV